MAKKNYKNIIIIVGIILFVGTLYTLYKGNNTCMAENFASTTPAAIIQLKARDLQDLHLSSSRLSSGCGIRPTLRGSPVTGYLRF